MTIRYSKLAFALAVLSAQASTMANELPIGGQVQAGQANISQSDHQLTVTQSSDRAVIDWQSFDVGSDAQVHFDQPSVSSATLNRVLSSNPTQVMGRITAPGQVFLVNPNGVLFGPNSQVDVGGLAASTLDIDNTDFMAGDLRFHSGAGSGSITSQGEIETTLGGFVALLAPEVINEGLIVAPYGRVAMAAGEQIEIDLDGQGRWVQVEPALVGTLIENRYAIEVNAGQILLSSRAVNELARGVIRQSGTLTANSMVQSGGRILLEGDDIRLSSSAQIQANGAVGGGDVLIGGDWQGGQNAERRVFEDPNTLHQADTVRMEAGASIQANATDSGDGGTVVLWSDIRKSGDSTRAYGEIQAQGGPNGGDGGQVETSGAYLDVAGISVSTLATAGANGVWLLDPADIQLTDTGTDSIPGLNGPESASSIGAGVVRNALVSGNVEIYTGAAKNGTASITMAGSVKWNFLSSSNPDGNSLTIRAHNDLTINGTIGNYGALTLIAQNITIGESAENNVILSTDGSDKDIILKATNDIDIADGRMFSTNGGDLVIWSDSDNSGAGRIELNDGLNVSTGGGDFIVGGGADGDKNDRPDGSAISSGSTANPGVQIGDASSTITVNTYGGDIWIRGQRNNSATAAAGISFGPYVNMQSGTGEIDIQGSSNNGYGIDLGTHNLSASDFIIRSNKTSGTAIRLVGAQTNTGASSYQAIRSGMSGSEQPFLIAGAGGNIIVQGTNSTSSVTAALSLGNLNVLGTGGTISIDGGTQAVEFGSGSRLGTDDGGKVIGTSASDVTIRSDRLDASAVGIDVRNLSLLSASDSFTTLSLPTGSLSVTDYTIGSATNTLALTLSASLGTGSSDIDGDISIYAGDLTINSGVTITAQSNKDIVLASTGDFINNSGSGLLTVSGSGRWLVFAADAAGNTYGSLNSNNQAVWGEDASTFNASEIAGNRYVFAGVTGQTVDDLTVTTTDSSKVYGTAADLSNAYSITGGNVAGQSGVYLASTATNYELSDLYSTNPTISSTKAPVTEGVGTAPITISGGVALSGLTITQVSNGELTVTPMPLTLTATANSKEYDGNATATGTIAHNGVDNDEISIGFSSASFSQSAVGKSLTVTFNGPSLSGRDQANYQLPGGLVTATANINQRTLTLDGLAVQDKVYDTSTTATVSGFGTLSNIINSEDVSLNSTGATATFDSSSAGQRTATVKGLQLMGTDNANYTIGNPTATANILQLALTPVWTPSDKVYDGNASATVAGAITPLGSDEVTLSFDKAFADANAGNGKTINLTNIQLGGKNGSNYSVLPTQTTTANITPKALTATASVTGKTYDGNDDASVTLSLAGLVSGEDLGQTVTASFDSVNAGTRTATIDSFQLDDGTNGLESNYTLAAGDITFTANTATIATRAITLTAADVSQVYGDSDATLSVTASANGLASTDTLAEVTGTLTRESGSDVGNYDVALGTGSKASNYAITFDTDNNAYEITPKALTATASVTGKTYDGNDDASVTLSLAGLVSGEDLGQTVTASFDSVNAGTRTATIDSFQLDDGMNGLESNYTLAAGDITFTANTATIATRAITLTAADVSQVYGDSDATLSVTASANGLASTDTLAEVTGTLTRESGSDVGNYDVALGTGSKASNYAITFDTDNNAYEITPKALTATASVTGKTYDGNDDASVTLSLAGLVSGEDLGQTVTASFDSVNAGTRTATIDSFQLDDGTNGLESNYTLAAGDITFTANTATIATRAITLTAADVSQVYGDSDATLSVTASANGLASTDTLAEVTGTLTRESGSDVGNYDVALGTGSKASNYAITFDTDNNAYEITPKALTATASVTGKTYDGNDDASVTLSLAGLVSGEDLGQTVTASFDSVNAGTRTATIDSFQLDDGTNGLESNYTLAAGDITFTANTATIATRAITLTAADVSQVYGDSDATLSVTASANGLASTDTLAEVTGTLTRESGSDVGNYDVALGTGSKASNYAITFDTDNNAYEITPKALTATASVTGKTYDGNDDASVTLSLAGLVSGEDLGQTVTASFDSVNAGTRTATIDSFQLDDGTNGLESNYTLAAGDITFTANTATIATRAITLTAADVSQVYGDSDATLSVTASANGLASTDTLAEVTGTLTRESGSDVGNYDVALGTGSKASNYAITFDTDNNAYEITPKALTATASVTGKTYDGNDDASVTLSLAGLVSGEDLGQTVTASFDSVNAGTRTATIDSFQLDDGTNGLESNYTLAAGDITFTANTATIATRAITLTAADVSQVYGDSDATLSVTASANGLASTDTLAEVTGTLTRESGSDVGNYDVALGTGSKASNYVITFATDNDAYEITPLALTLSGFTVADKTYDSTTAATVSSYGTFTNLVGADVVSIDSSSVSAVFDNANVGTRTATVTGIALSGADAGNYSIADQTDSASITAFTLDLGLTASDKVYDGSDDATVNASPNAFSGDDVSITFNAAFSNENVADNKVISLSSLSLTGTDAGNYALPSTPSVTANITPKPLTLTYTANNRVYDGTTDATVSFTDDRISGDTLTVSETAAFADKNVGNGKTVSITGVTLGGTDAANYSLVTPTNPTANITARDLTLTYTGNNRVYDGTTDATVSVTDDRITDDVLSITQTAAFADKDVGSGKTISLSGVSVTGTDAGNYNVLTPTNPTADITARSLTVTIDAANKVYDGNTNASVTYADNRVDSDVLSVTGTASFANKNVGTGKTVTASSISLSGTDAGNYTVNTSATDTADITTRTLTVNLTGDNRVYDGTTDATISSTDDRVSGDNLALDYTAAFSDPNVGNGKSISVTGISLLGSDAGNYSVASSGSTTAKITARSLTVTADASDKVYDGNTTASVTYSDNRISGDDVSVSGTATFDNENVGSGKTVSISGISLSGDDAGNYTVNSTASDTAAITARALTLNGFSIADKTYDQSTSATVASYGTLANLVSGDTVSIDSSSVSSSFDSANVGTRTATMTGIVLSGADAANYSIADQTGSAEITAFTLDLGLTATDKVYDGTDSASVTASPNEFSGDDVSVTFNAAFSNKNVANNKVINLTNLTLSGTDAANYALPASPSVTADITARDLTLTYTAADRVYDGSTDASVSVTDNRISGDTLSITQSAAFADKDVGSNKTVTLSGVNLSGTDAANYNLLTPANPTADITARDLTLTYTGTNRVYDGTTDATVTVSDDRVSGDVLSIAQTVAFADKNVGSGKSISLSGVNLTGTDAANYNLITPTNPTADITARSLTVTADASDKVYDGNNTASVTYSDNRVSGDVLTVSGSAAFDNKHVGSGKSVTVSGISLAGADAANYSVNTSASDTANISARTLSLTLTGDNRVYDGTTDATVSVADDRVAGDNIALDYSAAFSDKNVGSGKTISVTGISLLGSDASNYSVASSDSTTGNIMARALNFTVAAQNKVYDQSSSAQVNITDDRVSGDNLSASFTASFSDDQAGANKAVAINGFALNGTDAANYSYTAPTSTTASITQRVLDLTVAVQDKVYDGTQSATVTVTDDRLSGDTLSYTYNAQFADKNVGTGKAVQLAGLALTGADASNYQLPTNAAGSASITARTLNISANPINRVYDGTRAVNVSYSDDRIAGDDFSISATALMADKLAGANKSVSFTNLSLLGHDSENYSYVFDDLGVVDISRRTLTVSARANDKNFDATRLASLELEDNRIAGDLLSLTYSALFNNAEAGSNKPVDLLSLNLSGPDSGNYRLGAFPQNLRASIVSQANDYVQFLPAVESDVDQVAFRSADAVIELDQNLISTVSAVAPATNSAPITVDVIAEPGGQYNGMVVVTMAMDRIETARFALPSSIRSLKPVGDSVTAEMRGGAPLPSWLKFDPDTMEFETLGDAELDRPIQVDLRLGEYRVSVLVMPE